MANTNKKRHLKSKLIIIQLSCLVFSLSAGFVSVYAWYTTNRKASVSITSISVESGLTVHKFSYYNGNSLNNTTGKFYGYEPDGTTSSGISYATDFTEITGTETNGVISYTIPNTLYVPKKRCTFAIEVSSGFTFEQFVRLELTSYVSAPSAANFIAGTTNGIRLAQAISIYGKGYDLNSTSALDVSSFINATSSDYPALYNRFDFAYPASNDTTSFTDVRDIATHSMSEDIPTPAATNGQSHVLYLFSLAFSNDASTFYSETSSSGYWSQDSTGNSNPYESLNFNISSLSLIVDRLGTITSKLHAMGGSCASTSITVDGTTALPTCTKTGYTFAGWYDPDNNVTYTNTTAAYAPSNKTPDLYATYTVAS